jgi:LacI family transcriptional regulator
MALGFLRAMREQGRHAPEDVAVVGFDDIPLARYSQPSLSTVSTSRFDWGATAMRQLLAFVEDETPFETRRFPTRFIARQSSQFSSST